MKLKNKDKPGWVPQAGSQTLFLASSHIFEVLYEGTRGPGKGLAAHTKILTTEGWVRADEVTYSSVLIAEDGSPTKVLGIYPQGIKPTYKMRFSGGTEIHADDTHRWKASANSEWSIKTTKELFESKTPHFVPIMSGPAQTSISPSDRLAILQRHMEGNMDSCGILKKDGSHEVLVRSKTVADIICDLAWSLGGTASVHYDSRSKRWYVKLILKPTSKSILKPPSKSTLKRRIERIEKAPAQETICFAVDHPSHCFVIEGYVVTHNTDAMLMSYAQHVGKGYGEHWRGIIFRRTFPELKDIIAKSKRWFVQLFPKAKYNEADHVWTFPNGEQLYFSHMRLASDYFKYHGHEYPFIGWEELTTWADDTCYRGMVSCCRSSCPDKSMPRMYRASANPYGAGHNWVKRRFRLPGYRHEIFQAEEEDQITGKTRLSKPRLAIHGKLTENKVLLASDPDYVNTLHESARNGQELKAWLEGSWDIVSGGMFDGVYDPKIHIVKTFKIPSGWTIDRAFDWGSSKPFSLGWFAESDGSPYQNSEGEQVSTVRGDIFHIAEWYGTTGKPNEGLMMEPTEFADGVVERESHYGFRSRVKPGPADLNIFTKDRGASMHDIYKRKGVRFQRANKGPMSRQKGWQVCRDYLKNALPNEDGTPREYPGLYIFDGCKYFQDLVPTLSRSDKDPDDIDTNSEDHIADMLRYRLTKTKMSMHIGTYR